MNNIPENRQVNGQEFNNQQGEVVNHRYNF